MDTMCIRGEDAPHNSEDCIDVGPLAPIVQNKIQKVKYCGKPAQYSLQEMVRPVLNTDE